MKERIEKQVALLEFLVSLMPNCVIGRNIVKGQIVVNNNGKFGGLGKAVDCTEIYRIIEERGANVLSPFLILEEFENKGYIDIE